MKLERTIGKPIWTVKLGKAKIVSAAVRAWGRLWFIRAGDYFFTGAKFANIIPCYFKGSSITNAEPISTGWILAPDDATDEDFDLIIDLARFNGFEGYGTFDQLQNRNAKSDCQLVDPVSKHPPIIEAKPGILFGVLLLSNSTSRVLEQRKMWKGPSYA